MPVEACDHPFLVLVGWYFADLKLFFYVLSFSFSWVILFTQKNLELHSCLDIRYTDPADKYLILAWLAQVGLFVQR